MEFSTSDEAQEIQQLAAQIFGDQSEPQLLGGLEAQVDSLDRELWTRLAEANLLGVTLPEEVGGMGFGLFELGALLEEQGRRLARVPLAPVLGCAGLAIARFGSLQQQSRLLAPLARGDEIVTAAFEELGGGRPEQPATTATAAGDGYRLQGEKVCVPAADVASAILVTASTSPQSAGAFLVDPRAAGVSLERQISTHGEPVFQLTLDGVEVAADSVLGDPQQGRSSVTWMAERATIALAWLQLGVSQEALRRTAEYTSTRKQFGRAIGSFQAVATRAADGYIDIEALRSVLWQATWLLTQERPAASEVQVAKWWAASVGHRVGHTAQHLHGGIGSDIEYPIHRYFLWSQHLTLGLGARTEQLAHIGEGLVA